MTNKIPIHSVMFSGVPVNYEYPERTLILQSDIERGARNLRRYVGSVDIALESHLILCINIAFKIADSYFKGRGYTEDDIRVQVAYCGTHDYTELYLNDLPTGLKNLLPKYLELEKQWDEYIHHSIGLPLKERDEGFVALVDRLALLKEMKSSRHPGFHEAWQKTNTEARQYFEKINELDLTYRYSHWGIAQKARIILSKKTFKG